MGGYSNFLHWLLSINCLLETVRYLDEPRKANNRSKELDLDKYLESIDKVILVKIMLNFLENFQASTPGKIINYT
jgi:hypothetical protein